MDYGEVRGKYARKAILTNGIFRLKPDTALNRSMDSWQEIAEYDDSFTRKNPKPTEDYINELRAAIHSERVVLSTQRRSSVEQQLSRLPGLTTRSIV